MPWPYQGDVSAIEPLRPWLALTTLCVSVRSRSHFVYSAGRSLLTAAASKLICASPSQPRRSRWGQSLGTSMRLDNDA